MFKGSYVALVTPMDEQGNVDYQDLEACIEFHVENKTDGIVSVGTTGESATLPFKEHVDVVKSTVDIVAGRIPVIAGSGANSTSEAVFLTEQMEALGVDGFLSVVPYYNKPQQAGMVAHFEAVADATSKPVLLYNVPGRTVADMLPATVAQLAKHPNIVGLKDATGDIQRLKQTQALVPDDFVLLSGDDGSSCEFLEAGGHGVISVTANIVPKAMAEMCKSALNNDFEACRRIDASIEKLHHALFIEPNPVMPKWALYKMQIMKSAMLRLPMVLPELASKKVLEDILIEYGLTK
ncbi:4-hydroxy-tetrahydrodipicolinate synthase [Alteromonas sp. 5E99-2]|uniref:4-hydroxy-tetrahydrodipicolinate synthase n=1 Tax=Alteromonas sp. 5E99-2 TaxID=2817683 RepID=UPI001A9A16D5|nr:4-hydroxy-tetrahydrodipicolinate synthase [Alteromonas sp. 5E99-2]MBO1255567.1 4-hydroxy-tetrahydrodipicolinate synthase [Alteromonas sp. 5E99-2]